MLFSQCLLRLTLLIFIGENYSLIKLNRKQAIKILHKNTTSVLILRWAGHVARMEEGRGAHKVLVGRPEGKRPLGRPRRRWDDNIKMDLEVGRGCGDWMELAKDRDRWRALVSTVMNFGVP